jgi:hypothetical protein
MPKSQPKHQINGDLARVFELDKDGEKQFLNVLCWGDEVEVLNAEDVEKGKATRIEVKATKFIEQPNTAAKPQDVTGFIIPPKGVKAKDIIVRIEDSDVLKVDFVDVQQGDGSVIMTPKGKTILIDGGDNQLFARYLAGRFNRFNRTSIDNPREIECILVTHGDADHFAGLVKIHGSETVGNDNDWRRLFLSPQRVYHNGLVKRPSKDKIRRTYRMKNYRFAEYLYDCVAETTRTDLREEIGFLKVFDAAIRSTMDIVDMPDRRASLLVRLILQNDGRLSQTKRATFSELKDEEISAIEEAVASLSQDAPSS